MEEKNLSLLLGDEKKFEIRDSREAIFFAPPYSESDILELQNMFLSKGFHYIKTANLKEGRALVLLFLQSLHCYRNPGCFTQETEGCSTVNIAKELEEKEVELFFYENPQIDFLWIEMSPENEPNDICYDFMRKCESLLLEKKMPILIVHRKR